MPAVPPLAETLPGFDLVSWFGLLGPAGMPAQAVRRIDAAVREALADPAFRARLTADGSIAVGMEAARFARFLAVDYARWGEAVRLSGAQVD
jgi:tripartite-type tricarboxylate transporter receptor subunit TctC